MAKKKAKVKIPKGPKAIPPKPPAPPAPPPAPSPRPGAMNPMEGMKLAHELGKEMHFFLPKSKGDRLIAYLVKKPYDEVNELVQSLRGVSPVPGPVLEFLRRGEGLQ